VAGRPWWDFEPCGSETAYWRHIGRGEEADQFCKDAHAAEERWRQRGLAAAAVLRRAHAEVTALRKADQPVPTALAMAERTYQRLAKRRQRRARAAVATGASWCARQTAFAARRAA
jgi:hypothetical protein